MDSIRPGTVPLLSRRAARRALVCFSAAGLLFLRNWQEIFPGTQRQQWQGLVATPSTLLALWAVLLASACALYLVQMRIRNGGLRTGAGILSGLLVFLLAFPTFYRQILIPFHVLDRSFLVGRVGAPGLIAVGACILTLLTALCAFRPRLVYLGIRSALLMLSPIPLFLTWSIARGMPGSSPAAPSVPTSGAQGHRHVRAVVLIFDEMDQQYAFSRRPTEVHLPNIDRFSQEFDQFQNCWPAAGNTYRSIPSLATGGYFTGALPGPGLEVRLKAMDDGVWRSWRDVDDVFVTLGALGWQSRMIQWRHVFSQAYISHRPGLSVYHQCEFPDWQAKQEDYLTFRGTLRRCRLGVGTTFQDLGRIIRPDTPEELLGKHRATALAMRTELGRALESGTYDMVWAHLPFPHSPAIWNARTGRYLTRPDPAVSNLHNMELADQVVGEVRSILEKRGDWDGALVIVTSDHWQRDWAADNFKPFPGKYAEQKGFRVPLLVKWPGQKDHRQILAPVCTSSVRGMIESVAHGMPGGTIATLKEPPAELHALLTLEAGD